jgi:cytoskeletal protein RodZ
MKKNSKHMPFFHIGSTFIVLGAVLFLTGFFMPKNSETAFFDLDDEHTSISMAESDDNEQDASPITDDETASDNSLILEEPTVSEQDIIEEATENEPEPSDEPDNNDSDEEEATQTNDAVHVVIRSGLGAVETAELLENLGIVDNAENFARFIASEGMARRISAGEYHIEKGLEYSDVLKVISAGYRRIAN